MYCMFISSMKTLICVIFFLPYMVNNLEPQQLIDLMFEYIFRFNV